MTPTKIGPTTWHKQSEVHTRRGGAEVMEIVMVQGDVIAKCLASAKGCEVTMANTHADWLVRVICERALPDCIEACLAAAETIGAVLR